MTQCGGPLPVRTGVGLSHSVPNGVGVDPQGVDGALEELADAAPVRGQRTDARGRQAEGRAEGLGHVAVGREAELERLHVAARHARSIGLRVNAGHGLNYDNVAPVTTLADVEELNIGFAIVARAVFDGVDGAVRAMLERIAEGAKP